MNTSFPSSTSLASQSYATQHASKPPAALLSNASDATAPQEAEPLKEAFSDFVGQTLFGSMLSSMRESVGKPAYFHGGRAEEVFQQQLDQKMVEEISNASAESFVDPMFDLFQMQRRG